MSSDIYLGEALTLDDKHQVTAKKSLSLPRKIFGHMHLRGMTGSGRKATWRKGSCSVVPSA